VLADEIAEAVADFRMPWDGGLAAGLRIEVEVVPGAMPMEHASGRLQFADKFPPLHTGTSISLV
jgi:hypothetical protein